MGTEAVLTSTHNLRRAKIRKIGITLHTSLLLLKMGNKGVFVTRKCYADVMQNNSNYFYFFASLLTRPCVITFF